MNSQRQAAKKFKEFWLLAKDSETGGYSKFWLSLLSDVLGVDDVFSRIDFQSPVPMKDTTKYLDAWIPETKVLIEHKSRGIKLDAPQSGHGGKTPYEQALEYNQARGYSNKARWIVTCNFDEIWVYDMDKPLAEPQKIRLGDLPKEVARLGFLVDSTVKSVREQEKEISIQAGRIVGELYKELLKCYADPGSSETLKDLNRLCVRLVFLFYAEDAELFPKDAFWRFLKETPAKFLRGQLMKLFRVLDTPGGKRDPYLEPELCAFPYTNGGLFKGADESDIPPLDDEIKELLIRSSNFDWREISPTIFGALFESTLNPVTRRAGGMVYTSVENIHKVIDPLFLNDLARRVNEILYKQTDLLTPNGVRDSEKVSGVSREQIRLLNKKDCAALLALQGEMASLTFLDPACGSGNFLTETYICLRRLENRIIAALQQGQGELDLGISVKVSIAQFHGIEINDFAVSVAKTALWIAEAQMLQETAQILHREPDYLPLKDYNGIVEGNALRMDWPSANYIMGNPPFIGYSNQSAEQKSDILALYRDEKGRPYKTAGKVDYVAGWYWKAAEMNTRCAFVSTNSITQGEQVASVFKPLAEKFGLEIDFAWRTFRWDSEATEKAHVHCVIVGFHLQPSACSTRQKQIFDGNRVTPAAHINGYLMDAPYVWIESRTKPLCDVPEMVYGSKPTDGGFLFLSEEERNLVIAKEPVIAPYIRRFLGATEFLNDEKRYCLWLNDATPSILRQSHFIHSRIAAVRDFRLASSKAATRESADTPSVFQEVRQPNTQYLLVPCHSSEIRKYIPIGYLPSDVICGNANLTVPSATLYHFGVLTSSVHMAWMRTVAGRLEMRYRYSANIVYNNFPWPDLCATASPRETISKTAQAILDARAAHPDCSLADLYDPLTMPPDLRAAHEANDRAVLTAYGLAPDTPEPEIVAHLFKLYAEMTKKGAKP